MKVLRTAGLPMERPPESDSVGEVRVGGYFRREAPSSLAGAVVHHGPSARSPWKVNPSGQTLVVLAGRALVQVEGEAPVALEEGDAAWCPPGFRHWDGAMPDRPVRYLALQEEPAVAVSFLGRVDDEDYDAALRRVEDRGPGADA